MEQQKAILTKLEAITLGQIPASGVSTDSGLPRPSTAAAEPLSPALEEPLATESTLNSSDNTWTYELSGLKSSAEWFYDYHYYSFGTSSTRWKCANRQLRNRANSVVNCMTSAAQVNKLRLQDGTLCTEFLTARRPGPESTALPVWDARLKETAGLLTKAVLGELNRLSPVSRSRKDTVGAMGQAIDKCKGMWQTSAPTPTTLLSMLTAPAPAAPVASAASAASAAPSAPAPVAAPRQAAPVITQRSISNFLGFGMGRR